MVDANTSDLEIFGRCIGRLAADGNRLVFHVSDQACHELDRRSFAGVIEAERQFTKRGYGVCTGVHRPSGGDNFGWIGSIAV